MSNAVVLVQYWLNSRMMLNGGRESILYRLDIIAIDLGLLLSLRDE